MKFILKISINITFGWKMGVMVFFTYCKYLSFQMMVQNKLKLKLFQTLMNSLVPVDNIVY
jgi:hypothetical protein